MKKNLSLLLAVIVVAASLSGCGERDPEPQLKYRDGDYRIEYADFDEDGYKDYLEVKIESDIVRVVEFDALDKDDNMKTDNSEMKKEMQDTASPNLPYRINPLEGFALSGERFNTETHEPIEFVAGATRTSKSFNVLMSELLAGHATQGLAETQIVPNYRDGSYTVTAAEYDENGYCEYVTVEFAGGKATVAEYDAKDEDAKLRSADGETKFPVSQDKLAQDLKDAYNAGKSLDEIETVAGATRSSDTFKALVQRAVANARYRGPQSDKLSTLKDGVYRAEMSEFTNGWKDYVVAAVSGGEIQILEYNSKNEKGSLKSADAEFAASLESATKPHPQISPADYHNAIIAAFDASSNRVSEMENVAGATVSANNFKLMMGHLIGFSMELGNTQTLAVSPITEADTTTVPGQNN